MTNRDTGDNRAALVAILEELDDAIAADGEVTSANGFFRWRPVVPNADGSIPWPHCEYLEPMERLWNALARAGLGRDLPDYIEWLKAYSVWPYDWIRDADGDEIDHFLFAIQRQERFHTGLWASMVLDGTFARLIRRYLEVS